jgi:hypothetical protein
MDIITTTGFDILEDKISQEVNEFLELVDSDKFDIFKFRQKSKGLELPLLMNQILDRLGLIKTFNISKNTLFRFSTGISEIYVADIP